MDRKLPRSFRILLLEDNDDLSESLQALFSLEGHQIKAFTSGEEILASQEEIQTYDLLITDYYLPGMHGIKVIAKLREKHPQLKAIVLTGAQEGDVAEEISALPQTLLLSKPLDFDHLELKVRELVQTSKVSGT